MKQIGQWLGLLGALLLLVACRGSEDIQGTWKAADPAERASQVQVTEQHIKIDGERYPYTQNALGNLDGVQYYTISLKDEDNYLTFLFPTKSRKFAFLIQPDDFDEPTKGEIVMVLDKSKQPTYHEYVEMYPY